MSGCGEAASEEGEFEMTDAEELVLGDVLTDSLRKLTGVQQALWHVRDDSTEYPMCQMLAGVVAESVNAILEVVPEEWRVERLCY